MKLNEHFKVFDGNISLNPVREEKINSALSNWENKLKSNEAIKDIFNDFYTQGSYSTKTVIRPQNGNEFDIDTILVLNLEEEKKPKEVIKFISDTLRGYEKFKDRIIQKDRCVRVKYAGEFHVDIVPVKPSVEEHVLIPCKSEDEWKETNPAGFKKWCNGKNKDSNYKLVPVTKIVKYWRDNFVGKDTAPKSILLTAIIGNHIVGCSSVAESLVLTLESIVKNLDDFLNDDNEPYVINPSLESENLARDWDKGKFDIFKNKLEKFAKESRTALNDDNITSIEKWQVIFGSDKFPSELPEEAKTAEQIAAGAVYVSKIGALNSSVGKKIVEHRFFGVSDIE